jgi:hypothetical protein
VKIAPTFLTNPENHQKLAEELKNGGTVTIQLPSLEEVTVLQRWFASPEFVALHAQFNTSLAKAPVTKLDPVLQQELAEHAPSVPAAQRVHYERVLLGAGTGAVTGFGVGQLVEALISPIAPHAAKPAGLACVLILAAMGADVAASEAGYNRRTKEATVKVRTQPA